MFAALLLRYSGRPGKMIRRIFWPTGKACLARKPYFLTFMLLHIVFLIAMVSVAKLPILPLLCLLVYTWVKININAQRCRDSGLKGRYVVILSILVYLISPVVSAAGFVLDDEYLLLGAQIYIWFDGLVFFMFMFAPTEVKTAN
ncbi:hypothetical protein [Kosakonia cowanii]|jgi:uncharacterized membrane protein YhaH (DUF805 family)|uniref:hypothetical protein n=2 Tax=Enterobacteriaceae TaxID=543 RepID=UPI0039A48E8B